MTSLFIVSLYLGGTPGKVPGESHHQLISTTAHEYPMGAAVLMLYIAYFAMHLVNM